MNFRQLFSVKIDAFISNFIENREVRTVAVKSLVEDYALTYGEPPAARELEKLADYLMHEELTDTNKYKVAHNEYPILSERQFERRYEREYSLSLADNYDTESVNRAKPDSRHRTAKEHRFVDKLTITKNRRRNAAYKRDTSAGEILCYNLRDITVLDAETGRLTVIPASSLTEPFVDCIGTSEHMRRMADRVEIVGAMTTY